MFSTLTTRFWPSSAATAAPETETSAAAAANAKSFFMMTPFARGPEPTLRWLFITPIIACCNVLGASDSNCRRCGTNWPFDRSSRHPLRRLPVPDTLDPALPNDVLDAAEAVLELAHRRNFRLATAESCTGGL